MRIAQSYSDGTAQCFVCGWYTKGTTQESLDNLIGNHLREVHDRIFVTPRYHTADSNRPISPCSCAYHSRALSAEERRFDRNQPDPEAATLFVVQSVGV
jgi:hypothetical protein